MSVPEAVSISPHSSASSTVSDATAAAPQPFNSTFPSSSSDSIADEPDPLQRTVSQLSTKKRKFSLLSRKSAINDVDGAEDYSDFTEDKIYGEGLTHEDIQMRRTQTRQTIINTLEERAAIQESTLNKEEDEECAVGTKEEEEKETKEKDVMYRLSRVSTKAAYENAIREEQLPTSNDGVEFQQIDPELVTWESESDVENPRNWPSKRKWRSTAIVSIYTLLSPFASTMLSPAIESIDITFGNTNQTLSSLMVSIYVLAWALFPTVVAPCSEIFGRKYVLDVGIWILLIFNIACAVSQNLTQMIVFRFFAGVGGTSSIIIGAGVLGDLFDNDERGRAMAVYSLGPTMGPCISALISGYIVEYTSWRWCFWVLVMLNGAVAAVGFFALEETYAPTLLQKKAQKLRKATGNPNLHTIYEVATGETTFDKFYINFTRPLTLLFTHPMVFGLGIFMAIAYGCLYILIVGFPSVWSTVYGFSKGTSGLMYLSFLIGYLLGILSFQKFCDKLYNILTLRNNGVRKPEFRLPGLLISGIFLPVGLFWFGWAADKRQHYILVEFGAGIFAYALIGVFYCIQSYLIEMNPRFAASSIAAASIFRSFLGFAFPLFAPKMFANIGLGWSCSVFGFIGLATGIPFPLYLYLKGEKLRIWANRRMDLSQAKRDAKNLAKLKKLQEAKAV